MPIIIRPAHQDDQKIIRNMVRQARLNPLGLDWLRFVVATDDDRIVGAGQIRSHRDKSRELASLVVLPAYQNQGIGTAIVDDLISYETGSLYLFCLAELAGYYERFGFYKAARKEIPARMGRLLILASIMGKVASLIERRKVKIIAMKRPFPD